MVLDDRRVSSRHGRIYRDPVGRWIVEDLSSRNGVWVRGDRIKARSILPGEEIRIGPFTLSLAEPPPKEIKADP